MRRFAVYLVGLMLLVVALWALLVMANVTAVVPVSVIAAVLLIILALGIMSGASEVDEGPTEIKETRQKVGDTEVRKSKMD